MKGFSRCWYRREWLGCKLEKSSGVSVVRERREWWNVCANEGSKKITYSIVQCCAYVLERIYSISSISFSTSLHISALRSWSGGGKGVVETTAIPMLMGTGNKICLGQKDRQSFPQKGMDKLYSIWVREIAISRTATVLGGHWIINGGQSSRVVLEIRTIYQRWTNLVLFAKSRSGNSTLISLARLSIGNAVPMLFVITLYLTLLEILSKEIWRIAGKGDDRFYRIS